MNNKTTITKIRTICQMSHKMMAKIMMSKKRIWTSKTTQMKITTTTMTDLIFLKFSTRKKRKTSLSATNTSVSYDNKSMFTSSLTMTS